MSGHQTIKVRPVKPGDKTDWARMRRLLFPDFDPPEIDKFFENGGFPGFANSTVFVAENADGALVGFAEATARPYAEGCLTTPVAYLEAWFVDEAARQSRIGAALVAAVENWARENGMKEIASDALPENTISLKAHAALGFREIERIVCMAKKL